MKSIILGLALIMSQALYSGPALGQDANRGPTIFSDNIQMSLRNIDGLLREIEEAYQAVDRLILEIDQSDPFLEGILQQAGRADSTGVDLATTMNAISLFSLVGGEQIFSINQESLQSCVSQSLYIGTIEFASATMSGIISNLTSYDARIADAVSRLSRQDERLNGVIEMLETLYRDGFIAEPDARSIARIIFRIDAIYNSVDEKLEEASNLIAAQLPAVVERMRLADSTLAQFRQSGIPCYHVMVGRWDAIDPIFLGTRQYFCIQQSGFRVTITSFIFSQPPVGLSVEGINQERPRVIA